MLNPFPKHIINGSLCFILHERRVLLLQRAQLPHIGLWTAPGGKMEHGESPQDNVRREVFEETGLHIQNPQLRAMQTVVDIAYPVHWMLFIFIATSFTGELVPPETEEGLLQWHSLETVHLLPRPYSNTLYWEHITNGQAGIWQGKLVYDSPDKLISEDIFSVE